MLADASVKIDNTALAASVATTARTSRRRGTSVPSYVSILILSASDGGTTGRGIEAGIRFQSCALRGRDLAQICRSVCAGSAVARGKRNRILTLHRSEVALQAHRRRTQRRARRAR